MSGEVVGQHYEMVATDRLQPHPDNPRKGDVGAIAASIDRHGFYGAVVVQRSTGHVLAGNHRLAAAEQQGLDEVPVLWVEVDDATARRILLVDNRANERATWDYEQLSAVLHEVQLDDGDMEGLGWATHELDALLGAEWKPDADDDVESFSNDGGGDEGGEPGHSVRFTPEEWADVTLALDAAREVHGEELSDAEALTVVCREFTP